MNVDLYLRLLAIVAQTAPAVLNEVEQATHEKWGQDHVQQIAQGAGHLNAVLQRIANAAGTKAETQMPYTGVPGRQDVSHLDQLQAERSAAAGLGPAAQRQVPRTQPAGGDPNQPARPNTQAGLNNSETGEPQVKIGGDDPGTVGKPSPK